MTRPKSTLVAVPSPILSPAWRWTSCLVALVGLSLPPGCASDEDDGFVELSSMPATSAHYVVWMPADGVTYDDAVEQVASNATFTELEAAGWVDILESGDVPADAASASPKVITYASAYFPSVPPGATISVDWSASTNSCYQVGGSGVRTGTARTVSAGYVSASMYRLVGAWDLWSTATSNGYGSWVGMVRCGSACSMIRQSAANNSTYSHDYSLYESYFGPGSYCPEDAYPGS